MPATATDRIDGLTTSVAAKAPCVAATTAAITLSGLQTVNGVALAAGDRVLVKDQVDQRDNGIYVVSTSAWSRSQDFDGTRDAVQGTLVIVVSSSQIGTETMYRVTTPNPVVFGSSSITFVQSIFGSLDSIGVSFVQAGTGAVTRTSRDKMRDFVSVFDFMTTTEIADVQANTALVNVSAAINKALAAHLRVYFPVGTYLCGSQLTMQSSQHLWGAGMRSAILRKGFNGDLFASFPSQAGLSDLYLDGNGATYTGRLLPISSAGAGKQFVHRCVIKDAAGYCIEFSDKDAGSQSSFINCEIARFNGTSAGNYSVKITDTQQLGATPRKFIQIETNGTYFIDFGGCNNTYATDCFSGGYRFTADSRAVSILGGRIANVTDMTVNGAGNCIVGCDVFPNITVASGATHISLAGNSYNNTVTDSSANGANSLDILSAAYTPVITQPSGSFVLGNGTLRGEFARSGDRISAAIEFIVGSTTTFGTGQFQFSIPLSPLIVSGTTQVAGTAYMLDSGATVQVGLPVLPNGQAYVELAYPGSTTLVGTSAPWTWETGDILRINLHYLI